MTNLQCIVIYLSLTLLSNTVVNAASEIDDISEFAWQNRIIIVNANLQGSVAKNSDLQSLVDQNIEIEDRDIIWFFISPRFNFSNNSSDSSGNQDEFDIETNLDRILTKAFQKQLHSLVNEKIQHVVLIGKDGGIKSKSTILNLTDLFSQIDMMPMRIIEMRQGQ